MSLAIASSSRLQVNHNAWIKTFEDNFDGAADSPPDSSKWLNPDPDNDYPVQDAKLLGTNAYQDGSGNLVLRAVQQASGGASYTGAAISTLGKFTQTYGKFEYRAQLPAGGGGIWVAPGWQVGSNWAAEGEIDWEFWTAGMDTAQMYFHYDSGGHQESPGSYNDSGLATGFHIYTHIWDPGQIEWYIDGVLRRRLTSAVVTSAPMYLNSTFYIGGPAGSAAGTTFPQTMLLDYARAWRRA